jgi:cytochrome bd-type quinol oxidase subunit 2
MRNFQKSGLLVFGVAVFGLGIVIWWAGLNLPGTTGHSGSYRETLFVVSFGTIVMGVGGLIINAARDKGTGWEFWLSIVTIFVSMAATGFSFYLRASELGML